MTQFQEKLVVVRNMEAQMDRYKDLILQGPCFVQVQNIHKHNIMTPLFYLIMW